MSKAYLRGIAALAKVKKSAYIQSILAYSPTVYINSQIANNNQDKLDNKSEYESISAITQP
jgi:hypothetical protein